MLNGKRKKREGGKLTKKVKNDLFFILNGFTLLTGLWLIFSYNLEWYYPLGLLIGSNILASLIIRNIPDKKSTKKVSTKKNTTNKQKSKNENTISQNKKLNDKDLLKTDIDSLSGENFERLVYLYFKDKGFKPELTPKSGDHGVDLVITDPKDGFKIAVQCKRYNKTSTIGNGDLIKLEGGKKYYRCYGTLFITTSSYTPKAKEFAESTKMEIWNRLHVFDKIDKWRKEKIKKIS